MNVGAAWHAARAEDETTRRDDSNPLVAAGLDYSSASRGKITPSSSTPSESPRARSQARETNRARRAVVSRSSWAPRAPRPPWTPRVPLPWSPRVWRREPFDEETLRTPRPRRRRGESRAHARHARHPRRRGDALAPRGGVRPSTRTPTGTFERRRVARFSFEAATAPRLSRARAVNQDGRSSSLTAPNGPSQTAAIRAAMEDARSKAAPRRTILQTHGTGTPLGDRHRDRRGSRGVLLRRRRRGGAHKVNLVFGRGSRGGEVVVRPRGARGGRARPRDAVSSDVPRRRARSVSSPRDEPARRRGARRSRKRDVVVDAVVVVDALRRETDRPRRRRPRRRGERVRVPGYERTRPRGGRRERFDRRRSVRRANRRVRIRRRGWPTPSAGGPRGGARSASVGVPSSSASKSTARFTPPR